MCPGDRIVRVWRGAEVERATMVVAAYLLAAALYGRGVGACRG